MTGVKDNVYRPNKAAAKTYAELYALYRGSMMPLARTIFTGNFRTS